MAISYVGGVTAQKTGSNNNTYLTIDISGLGLAEGDLVIATSAKAHSAAGSVNMISSGWTAITGSPVASTNSAFSAYYKFMGSTPDTQVQFDDSNSGSWAQTAFVRAYRGVDATTPFDVTPTTDTGIDTANYNAPSITPSTAGAWIVAFGCGAGTACAAYSTPGDLSDFVSVTQADSADSVIGVGQKTDWSSGAFDPAAVTGSTNASGYTWAAMTLALRPASGGSTESRTVTIAGAASSSLSAASINAQTITPAGVGATSFTAVSVNEQTLTAAGVATPTFVAGSIAEALISVSGVATADFENGTADLSVSLAISGAASTSFLAASIAEVTLEVVAFSEMALYSEFVIAAGRSPAVPGLSRNTGNLPSTTKSGHSPATAKTGRFSRG